MAITDIPLMQAMGAKMSYLDTRQSVIAQNIANADTPNYRARELTDVDFGSILKDVASKSLRLERTNEKHQTLGGDIGDARETKREITYEVAPAGNAVIIEEQMVKATETTMDFNLLTNLMRKNVGMIRTALGRSQ